MNKEQKREKRREYNREYYQKNKEKIREHNQKNKEKNKEKQREYDRKNKEKKREYKEKNKEKIREYKEKRLGRKIKRRVFYDLETHRQLAMNSGIETTVEWLEVYKMGMMPDGIVSQPSESFKKPEE